MSLSLSLSSRSDSSAKTTYEYTTIEMIEETLNCCDNERRLPTEEKSLMLENQSVEDIRKALNAGAIIPQIPVPLDAARNLDEAAAQRLVQYYVASGATGIAFGCWPTRNLVAGIVEDVILRMVELARAEESTGSILLIAGIPATQTDLAVRYRTAGCHAAVLVSSKDDSLSEMLAACRAIAGVMPFLGIAFPPAWDGPQPTTEFYAEVMGFPALAALIAPGNTGAILRSAVAAWRNAGTDGRIPMLLGDGDRFLADLLTPMDAEADETTPLFSGVLSARAAFWTERLSAVVSEARRVLLAGEALDPATLTLSLQLGEIHDAVFDTAHDGTGALAGLYDVLAWSGLVAPDIAGALQPEQREQIDRIFANYPHFVDDEGDEEDEDDEFDQ
jgi:hypothetical protein